MKKIYISILTIVSLLLITTSCDFLEVDSQQKIDEKDKDEIFTPNQFIIGTYGMFTTYDYGFAYLGITDMLSDNSDKGSSATDTGTDKKELDEFTFTTTTPGFHTMWKNWYKTIGRATQTIEFTSNYTEGDPKVNARIIGEAKFLRAVAYFYLVRGWGDVTLQHLDLINRAPKEDVYAFIEQDLKEAMEILPISYDAANVGRATKGAAHGLLSKVYLYQKKYQEAYDAATLVVNKATYGYELMNDYSMIWRLEGENSTESLFEIQARGDVIAQGVQQYSQTQAPRGGSHNLGWGFNTPSQNLLDAYNAEGDQVRRNGTIIFRNSVLYDGQIVGATDNPMYSFKAYSSANKGATHTDKNVRYLRLGDIYLIQAEAANELGKLSEAKTALNTIRKRAKLNDVTATDSGSLREAIWKERRLELAMEHDRWFDLVRTGQAKKAMIADGKPFIEGKHELFPIPYNQLQETPAMKQNPGW